MNAPVLSGLLLDLYRYSRSLPMAEFQKRALVRLQQDLSFDTAWWGVAALSHDINSSFPFGLPVDYAHFYLEHVSDTDTLAEAGIAQLGHTVRFGPAEFAHSPGLSRLTQTFGIRQALCIVLGTPNQNLVMFISLYRHGNEPAFLDPEIEFCDCLGPHLWATWTTNWIAQIERLRAEDSKLQKTHAIVDQRAVLLRAEPRFLELMHAEWPRWPGASLPPGARAALEAQQDYQGSTLTLRFTQTQSLTLIEAREASALDRLSPRERVIAASFGEGSSYKQIAARLGLSPATVRHHLRRIYEKAGISRKSELTCMLR